MSQAKNRATENYQFMTTIEYRPIPLEFTKSGFGFQQIERVGDWAIYEQSKGKGVWFEVIHIKRHDGYEIGGKKIEPAETYPSSATWGVDGFTLLTLAAAKQRLQEKTQ